MRTSGHLMNAVIALVIIVNLQSLAHTQEEPGKTFIMTRYSPWLGKINTSQNFLTLEVDGEHFLVRNNPVNRIGIVVDGNHIGYAVRGTRVSPIPLLMQPAKRPSEVATENDRLIRCDYHLFGAGNIDYILANEPTNGDQPFAMDKE